jgi:lipoprotein-anchoring transpeptidase ErfK/SrfK
MSEPLSIEVNLEQQRLYLKQSRRVVRSYPVSTARNGAGELTDSECTPRGRHVIAEKIGAGCPADTVFVGRRATGERYDATLKARHPGRDWILTRILWLSGCEPGVNSGGEVDSHSRYIYIHGAPDDTDFAVPNSRGCIRMRNADVIELFERVEVGTPVLIHER